MKTLIPAILFITSSYALAYPAWLEREIKNQFPEGVNTKVNPPNAKKVFQYKFKGKIVYYIPSRCCDVPSALFDAHGKMICSPDGGMTGQGDGKCPDFYKKRTDEKIVWPN